MAIERLKRINEMIRREIATGLMRAGQNEGIATEKISVVAAEVASDLRGCVVMISIMADAAEADEYMKWLRRHRAEFQTMIAENIALKHTPKLFFKQTLSIEKGDHVLDILDKLEDHESEEQESDE